MIAIYGDEPFVERSVLSYSMIDLCVGAHLEVDTVVKSQ